MSGVTLQIRNGLPAALAPDYRISSVSLYSVDWTYVGSGSAEIVVPPDVVWIPLSLRFDYTTNASNANSRNVNVVFHKWDANTSTYLEAVRLFAHVYQPAGTTYSYGAYLGAENMVSPIGTNNHVTFALHDFVLEANDKIVIEEETDLSNATIDTLTVLYAGVLQHSVQPTV